MRPKERSLLRNSSSLPLESFSEDLPFLTVLVITRGRPKLLKEALFSILCSLEKSHVSFEILIGINGLDSESTEVANHVLHKKNYRIFESSHANPPGEARNQIVHHARGQWVYFADDDILVPPTLIDTFATTVERHPSYDIHGGPNLTPPHASAFARMSGLVLSLRTATASCSKRYGSQLIAGDCDDSSLILCNLFVRRELLYGSAFPERGVCAEENAAIATWRQRGAKTRFEPELAVYHERRPTHWSFAKQIFKYGRGRGGLIVARVFRWFHLVPSGCLLLAVTLGFIGAWKSLSILAASYVLVLIAGMVPLFRDRQCLLGEVLRSFVLMPLIHLAYGLGVLHGIFIDPGIQLITARRKTTPSNGSLQ